MEPLSDLDYVTSPYISYRRGTLDDLLRPASYQGVPACELEVLDALRRPSSLATLAYRYPADTLRELAAKQWILPASSVWQTHNVTSLEIEVTTHCNWRCQFCPVSEAPKQPHSMSLELFEEILVKAVQLGTVTGVSINSYNEPTADPLFEERARMIARVGLKLILHTNGSQLDEARLRMLQKLEVLDYLCFNLPSVEPDEFKRLTGVSARNLSRSQAAIEAALALGLPVHISVNGTAQELAANLPPIQQMYASRLREPLMAWETSDRCGLMRNRYHLGIDIADPLAGCSNVLNWLFISFEGKCFICCEDYQQKEVFGHISDGSLHQILTSEAAQLLRKRVFGAADSSPDFLCRHCSLMKSRVERVRELAHSTAAIPRPHLAP